MFPNKQTLLTIFCFFIISNSQSISAQKNRLDCHQIAKDQLSNALKYHTPGNKNSKANVKKALDNLSKIKKLCLKRLSPNFEPKQESDFPGEKWWLSEASSRDRGSEEDRQKLNAWLDAKKLYDWASQKESELAQGPLYNQFGKNNFDGKIRQENRKYVKSLLERANNLFENALPLLEKYTQ